MSGKNGLMCARGVVAATLLGLCLTPLALGAGVAAGPSSTAPVEAVQQALIFYIESTRDFESHMTETHRTYRESDNTMVGEHRGSFVYARKGVKEYVSSYVQGARHADEAAFNGTKYVTRMTLRGTDEEKANIIIAADKDSKPFAAFLGSSRGFGRWIFQTPIEKLFGDARTLKLRAATPVVNGWRCRVLELDNKSGAMSYVLYLGEDIGFAPVKYEVFAPKHGSDARVVGEAVRMAEVVKGHWLPLEAKTTFRHPFCEKGHYEVSTVAADATALRMGDAVSDAIFEITPAANSRVYDLTTGETYRVFSKKEVTKAGSLSNESLDRVVEYVQSAVTSPAASASAGTAQSPASRWSPWWVGALCLGAVGVSATGYFAFRRRKENSSCRRPGF